MFIDLAARNGVDFAPLAPATKAAIAAHLDPGLVASNPLDAWGTGADFSARFEACFDALLADEAAALGVFAADIRDHYYLSDGFAAAATAAAARTGKPVAFVTHYTQLKHDAIALRLTDAGIPVLDGTQPALVAIRGALAWRDFRQRPADPVPDATPARRLERRERAQRILATGVLDEASSLALLSIWDLPVVPHRIVDSEASALAAAAELGYPVALKTAVHGVAHKTEVRGVHLDVRDADGTRAAWRDLAQRLGPRAMVARMVPQGVEMALGMVRDPQFGALVTVGAGGVLIDLLADRQAALAPFGPATADRLVERLAMRRLLDGHRGAPAVDREALALTISRFSLLAAELADLVCEIDVNPLRCASEIVAVDALVVGG